MHSQWAVMRRSLQSAKLHLAQRLSLEVGAWNVSIRFEISRWNVPRTRIFDGQGAWEDAATLGRSYLAHKSITSMCVKVSDEIRKLCD